MSNAEASGCCGAPPRAEALDGDAKQLLARVQRLTEMPRPAGGYPQEWLVEASYMGDLTAIATLALRSGKH